ncbi:MAG TPA: hypothetical protein VL651_11080 [Bacteroidia bacterium]|jgi:hypothetical protein|nr:hypothetical protein [Bacteroidia bacterium]
MKKLFALAFIMITILSSCDMQKRLYRNGWYTGRNDQKVSHVLTTNNSADRNFTEAEPDPASDLKISLDTASAISQPALKQKAFAPVHQLKQKLEQLKKQDDPKKMSYGEARESIAAKGSKPQPLAEVSYYLAWAGVFSAWLGLGLLLLLAALLVSIFATNKTIKDGNCVDENLAIIARAKRICVIALIWGAIVFAIVLGVFLLITSMAMNAAGI